jgi:hypothetical protein
MYCQASLVHDCPLLLKMFPTIFVLVQADVVVVFKVRLLVAHCQQSDLPSKSKTFNA